MSGRGTDAGWGQRAPCSWGRALVVRAAGPLLLGATLAGCSGGEQEETYGPFAVAMTPTLAPYYDDGELTLYEVRRSVPFPLRRPDPATAAELAASSPVPYGRLPWITTDDLEVQITWTLTNLDAEAHDVELLVDPWNEFGRYWPGLALVNAENGEYLPNLSGYDVQFRVPGTAEDSGSTVRSRLQGTLTFQDVEELAIDLATVMNILRDPPPLPGGAPGEGSAEVMYANHAFAVENRSFDDALVARYVPEIVAGLVGFDLGLRTREPAHVAAEVAVELVDRTGGARLSTDEADVEPLTPPDVFISPGAGP